MNNESMTVIAHNSQTYLVSKYRFSGTRKYCVAVYEPTTLGSGAHTTITLENKRWWGSITSRELPTDVNAIPVGPTRSKAIRALRDQWVIELETVARQAVTLPVNYETDGYRIYYREL